MLSLMMASPIDLTEEELADLQRSKKKKKERDRPSASKSHRNGGR